MAASSSGFGSGGDKVDNLNNAMEEGGDDKIGGVACVEISFEEFLRHRQEEARMQGQSGQNTTTMVVASSGSNVEVDESPLKPSINRNKESLKLKLQMRRPINQLVEQGILPSPNTPPAYACQRVKLERARMGDLLKAKIQSRPSRQELVRQHILEETDPRVAPLLAEKQRMLKRARLADSLNDHLIHRPGPLELVKKNILHAPDESIEKAIKDGIVPFKATCEGATPGPPLPTKYICTEDDSSSDVSSPSLNLDSVSAEENTPETPAPPLPLDSGFVPESVVEVQNKLVVPITTTEVQQQPTTTSLIPLIVSSSIPFSTPASINYSIPPPPPLPPPLPSYSQSFTISTTSPNHHNTSQQLQNVGIFAVPIFGTVSTQVMTNPQQHTIHAPVFQNISQQQPSSSNNGNSSSSNYKSRSSKKLSKSKSQSKPKTIKFHEYRGPPSAQKSSGNNSNNSTTEQQKRPPESSYELLLQQQQLFLQWQLEWQHRFPKILLPAVSKMSAEEKKAFCSTLQSSSVSNFPLQQHHNLQQHHPGVGMDNNSCLPMQIISNHPHTNSVLILSSTTTSSSEPNNSSYNNNNNNTQHQTITYVPQQSQQTLVITTPSSTIVQPQQQTLAVESPITAIATGSSSSSKIEKPASSEINKVTTPSSLPPNKLNDWKVNELKAELKKRNLPVSGSKSQLVDRLQTSYLKNTEKDCSNNAVEQTEKSEEQAVKIDNHSSTLQSTTSLPQPQQQELKFYITNNGNSTTTTTLLNPEALEFLQKSGLLKNDGKDLTVIQPTSRSVLQQKIQQKLQQQQQAKTQLNLNNNHNNNNNAIKIEPGTTAVRTWLPTNNNGGPSLILVKTEESPSPKQEQTDESITLQNNNKEMVQKPDDPWVLKITETNPSTSSASFENCLADLLSETPPSQQPTPSTINHSSASESQQHELIKSQMVDDVLEILIRNGELPASAAQGASLNHHQGKNSLIPPAPPLPPTTFAVTLPTEITFRRLPHLPQPDNCKLERKGSLHGITSLTKEAEEILKIKDSLTSSQPPQNEQEKVIKKEAAAQKQDDDDNDDFMELEDNNSIINMSNKSLINGDSSSSIVIDELLTEAIEFPMDTEYSDWLESFSSENAFNNFNNHNLMDKTICCGIGISNNEDSHHSHRGDPLLSSTKSSSSSTAPTRLLTIPILDNNFPSVIVDHSGNNVLMDIDHHHHHPPSCNNTTNTETDLMKIKKSAEDNNVNVNLNNHTVNTDLWDFSF